MLGTSVNFLRLFYVQKEVKNMAQNYAFRVGDAVRFRHYKLGKLENTVLQAEGIDRHGWGPFTVIGCSKPARLEIRTSAGDVVTLPALWFVPNDIPVRAE